MPQNRRAAWTLAFVGALMVVGGAVMVSGALTAVADAAAFFDFLEGASLIGAGIGSLGLGLGWFDPPSPSSPMPTGLLCAAGAGLTVFIGVFILRCGMHQIGGYDHSCLVDFGWRLYQGQIPYADFPCTVPAGFALGGKFAFEWFGVSWLSLIEMAALFAMVTFVWSLFLFARVFGRGWTALLWAFIVQVFSMMLTSFWWYNPITAVTAVLYTLSAVDWLRKPADKIAMISYGASLLLMATMKVNDAGLVIPGFSLILFISAAHRWRALGVSLLSFACFLLLLALNHFSFAGMIDAYRSISSRGVSLAPFLAEMSAGEQRVAILEITCVVLPAVVALSQYRRSSRLIWTWIPGVTMVGAVVWFTVGTGSKLLAAAAITVPVLLALDAGRKALRSPGAWIGIVALLGGLYGCLTNAEPTLVNLPVVFVAATLLAGELCPTIRWNRYFCFVAAVLGCLGLAQGYSRARIRAIGPEKFFQYDDSKHVIQSGFFKGLHCGDIFYNVLQDTRELLRREPSATVWFGGRMEWAYAAFGKPSPRGEPVVWDPFTMYDAAQEDVYFDHLLRSRNSLIVLLRNDLSGFVGDEEGRLLDEYKIDKSYPSLTVLRLSTRRTSNSR